MNLEMGLDFTQVHLKSSVRRSTGVRSFRSFRSLRSLRSKLKNFDFNRQDELEDGLGNFQGGCLEVSKPIFFILIFHPKISPGVIFHKVRSVLNPISFPCKYFPRHPDLPGFWSYFRAPLIFLRRNNS